MHRAAPQPACWGGESYGTEERREGPVANEALRVAMAEAGETVESLAEKVRVDPKTAARWLASGRIPHPRTRVAVAQVLRRDAAYLSLGRRWESVTGEAFPQRRSIELIREVATTWT
ncbi:helix-turn-helix transcriptional regulator [Micromonospora sp. STR1s_5]|nr:helix-turn-helix transcriptional regulator [Micromonospora sp. STR1s_5]